MIRRFVLQSILGLLLAVLFVRRSIVLAVLRSSTKSSLQQEEQAITHNGCLTKYNQPICCTGKSPNCFVRQFPIPQKRRRHTNLIKTLSKSSNNNFLNSVQTSNQTTKYFVHSNQSTKQFSSYLNRDICFCDENCMITKDCCFNYHQVCSNYRVDCKVSQWGPWSNCNQTCGLGVRNRFRKILVVNKNGGQSCPVLKESRPCLNQFCTPKRVGRSGALSVPSNNEMNGEVAHLLPVNGDVQNVTRRYDMRWDVRRKLYLGRLILMNKTETPEPDPYCATYEITQVNQACGSHNLLWSESQLKSTSRSRRRRYTRPSSRYRRQVLRFDQNRRLYHQRGYNRQSGNTLVMNRNDWNVGWSTHASMLMKGKRICVTCYPTYMRENLGYRCTGSGLANVEVRWRALRTSDCQGKFRMISSPQRTCTCGQESTSFVFV